MKKCNVKFITFKLIFIAILMFSLSSTINTQGYLRFADTTIFNVSFLSAEYLDADSDSYQDDTRFYLNVYFNPAYFDGSIVRMDILFDIILPSGLTYSYFGFIKLQSTNCIIRFDVYNTVSEPGWYTINFDASIRLKMTTYHSFCTIMFDPPTGLGEGGGTPTVGF